MILRVKGGVISAIAPQFLSKASRGNLNRHFQGLQSVISRPDTWLEPSLVPEYLVVDLLDGAQVTAR